MSSTFTAIWEFNVSRKFITIKPKWTTANLLENGASVDSSRYVCFEKEIKIDRICFVFEWNKVLTEIKDDLKRVGYGEGLEGYSYLKKL